MIGRLSGTLFAKSDSDVLLDVSGVGYEVEVPLSVFTALPALGSPLALFTHMVVREDGHLLFGFIEEHERAMFRLLLRVNGVGPKLALALLSHMSAAELVRAVNEDDTRALVRIPGVGKKTAERLVIELRDRVKAFSALGSAQASSSPRDASPNANESLRDAAAGLQALGYKPGEIDRLLSSFDTKGLSSEALIRAALQSISKSRS